MATCTPIWLGALVRLPLLDELHGQSVQVPASSIAHSINTPQDCLLLRFIGHPPGSEIERSYETEVPVRFDIIVQADTAYPLSMPQRRHKNGSAVLVLQRSRPILEQQKHRRMVELVRQHRSAIRKED